MTSLAARLRALEQAQVQVGRPPIRIFSCNGAAEDGGPDLVESSRPATTPPGFVWAMTVCSCAGQGLSGCRYRGADDLERR
jgi:hypothetical protein